MDDPLLSSLCTICHIDPPKYTCPRCSVQTCSLPCAKRHKLWSSCNGIRDPTVYKPISEVATPWGIDHDYNFLHGIESRIERSEKLLIEDLGIVDGEELHRARMGQDEEEWNKRHPSKEPKGEVCVARALAEEAIRVIKAPKGMRRNKENTSNWNRRHRTISWQVEWIRGGGAERTLYKALGSNPIGDIYDALCEEERWMNIPKPERKAEKKRKAGELKSELAKKAKFEERAALDLTAQPILQNPETGAWNLTPVYSALEDVEVPGRKIRDYHLYLHRPLTPASFPKVLVPINPDEPLTKLLRKRDVLEFPTIHVLDDKPEDLPSTFMLEKDYLVAIGNPPVLDTDTEMGGTKEDESSDEGSSSDDESDESMEDGEIASG